MNQLYQARRDEEAARRDRSLAEFLVMLDGYKPLIPEEVTEYYLQRAGFDCSDPRLKRLLSLSTQKFISDLSRDAFHFAKLRVNGAGAGRGRPAAADRNRVVLTMDDLSLALGEHGVNVKKPDYCQSSMINAAYNLADDVQTCRI
ncbi:transcription initiation factor TFIID 23-30kDa subunit-domain-containing protein [Dioszegia hungarica]|uniref:Transcription initiation factor TFIID subunit 10 n=1 Tax=Dioszegia hungarica TaxID=4972 RepID=A0AA38LVV0_9TREE|nr:transcription initiation factor TFIID 23-30kDa subunit-domain-containing protein [Dioszegia hungarica]KAI9636928.1 transcription initiation factor TFIID 23-30kDa subunit-domain-containing protein [Dioszegia hungarica]